MMPLAGVGIIHETSSVVAPDGTIVSPRGALGAVGAMEVYIRLNLLYRTPTHGEWCTACVLSYNTLYRVNIHRDSVVFFNSLGLA